MKKILVTNWTSKIEYQPQITDFATPSPPSILGRW